MVATRSGERRIKTGGNRFVGGGTQASANAPKSLAGVAAGSENAAEKAAAKRRPIRGASAQSSVVLTRLDRVDRFNPESCCRDR
jgi:hypothetical protein